MHSPTMMKDLLAMADNAIELSRKAREEADFGPKPLPWHERYFRDTNSVEPDPIEVLLHARTYLADRNMTTGEIEAWFDLGWIQEGVILGTGQCSVIFEGDQRCGEESLTFCGACGMELCLDHAEKCCLETFCEFCLTRHEKGHPQWT